MLVKYRNKVTCMSISNSFDYEVPVLVIVYNPYLGRFMQVTPYPKVKNQVNI